LQITPQPTAAGWTVQVEAVEMLGAERLLYTRLDGEQIIVRTEEEQGIVPTIGSSLHITPRPERLHWFDAASGTRL
jgi:sn-glycerol 3-phosphate transport system ATP-binding protein